MTGSIRKVPTIEIFRERGVTANRLVFHGGQIVLRVLVIVNRSIPLHATELF
jgi:hypothetical protein